MLARLSDLQMENLQLTTVSQRREVTESPYARQKEIGTTADRGKSWKSLDLLANGSLRDRHVKLAILCAEDGIALVSQFMKVRVVGPHIHRKFKLANETRATHEGP